MDPDVLAYGVLGFGLVIGFALGPRWIVLAGFAVLVGAVASQLDFEARPAWFPALATMSFWLCELLGVGLRRVLPEWRHGGG